MPEWLLVSTLGDKAINPVLVEHIDSILKERASCLLDHAVKRVEQEAERVRRTTLVLVGGCLACSCRAWRELDESRGLAKVVSS